MKSKLNLLYNYQRFIFLLITIFSVGCASLFAQQITPEQVVQKSAAVITSAKTLEASFTLQSSGRQGKGSIKSSGNKFMVAIPGVTNWYNGKDLYTYNSKTGETTIITPTAKELLEVNPLLYVKNGATGYSYSFSSVKRNNKYVIDLLPKNAKSEIKRMTFTVNSTTYKIEKLQVTTSGGVTTVDITDFKTGIQIPDSEFDYPKSKYPKAEIIDLR